MVLTTVLHAALMITVPSPVDPISKLDSKAQVQSLRAEGPAGVEKFVQTHSEALARGDRQAREALDAICAQYDCYTSKLYWYTDLESAKAAARAEHKPILSLHLLGRLDEELSCANSRFFRKILYADKQISEFLRKKFVLHWKTVRPVPKVTIDFGDGRVLTRTITGNSIHYVLDGEGRPIDAIPGMVTPNSFRASLLAVDGVAQQLASRSITDQESLLKQWHQERIEQTLAAWESDIRKLNPRADFPKTDAHARAAQLEKASEGYWPSLGALHRAELGPEVRVRIAGSDPNASEASRLATTKAVPEIPMLRQLGLALAEDSARNEYLFHRQIHQWLSSQQYRDVDALDARVYAQLFRAPLDDPWYGLKPAFAYSAIDDTEEGGPRASSEKIRPGLNSRSVNLRSLELGL